MANKPSMSINLGLPVAPEVDSPELYSSLMGVYSAIRNVMYAVDSYTGNSLVTPEEFSQINAFSQLHLQKIAVVYVKLTEAVFAGHIINLWNSGGLMARKAVSATQRADGFAVASGAIGDHIPVCLMGACTLITGLTPGTDYYLSTTPGQIQTGATSQRVGKALSSNVLWFTP